MKELFRFMSIQKLSNLTSEPFGKINLSDINSNYIKQALTEQANKDKEKFNKIVNDFMASDSFINAPLSIDKKLTHIYKGTSQMKEYSEEDIRNICLSYDGNSIESFVSDPVFKGSKRIIVENLYFLSASTKERYRSVKILYKHLLKTIGLLEAIVLRDKSLLRILANPDLQFYKFDEIGNYFGNNDKEVEIISKKEKDDGNNKNGNKNSQNEDVKKLEVDKQNKYLRDIEHLVSLNKAKNELLDLHTKNKQRIVKEQRNTKPPEPILKKKKMTFWEKLFGSQHNEVELSQASPLQIKNPLLLKGNVVSEKSINVIKKLKIDPEEIDVFTSVNVIQSEIDKTNNLIFAKAEQKSSAGGEGIPEILRKQFIDDWVDEEGNLKPVVLSEIGTFIGTINGLPKKDEDVDPNLPDLPSSVGYAKILGEGRVMRVEEEYQGCVTANLAAVVNVAPFSEKSYTNRYLTRNISSSEAESSEKSFDETNTETKQSTNLKSEIEKVQEGEFSLEAGLKVSAQYGPTVGVEAHSNLSTKMSNSEKTNRAAEYARDITQRAINRIEKTTRELTKTERTTENEITSVEAYKNNTNTPSTGIYQFISEVYKSRLVQYDSRLLLEFMVPEPGSVLLYASNTPNPSADNPTPKPPEPFNLKVDDIQPGTYKNYLSKWFAPDVTPPPEQFILVSKVLYGPQYDIPGNQIKAFQMNDIDATMKIPDNYYVDTIYAKFTTSKPSPYNNIVSDEQNKEPIPNYEPFIIDIVNSNYQDSEYPTWWIDNAAREDSRTIAFSDHNNLKNITIAVSGLQARKFALTINAYCKVNNQAYDAWRIDTFHKLRQAYQSQLDEYNDKLMLLRQRAILSGGSLGRNPAMNRTIEKDELKRGCISILTKQSFETFDSTNDPGDVLPVIRFDQVKPEGEYVTFFETAFEWTNLTYALYPYFWANPNKTWLRSLNLKLEDPKHEEFLKAGFARVEVPVRPEFQSAIIKYLGEGKIWDGQDPDEIGIDDAGNYDPMFIAVWQEIMERQAGLKKQPEIIDEWEYQLPTNHQILTNGNILPNPPFV